MTFNMSSQIVNLQIFLVPKLLLLVTNNMLTPRITDCCMPTGSSFLVKVSRLCFSGVCRESLGTDTHAGALKTGSMAKFESLSQQVKKLELVVYCCYMLLLFTVTSFLAMPINSLVKTLSWDICGKLCEKNCHCTITLNFNWPNFIHGNSQYIFPKC